jgi:uncharacterized glyoxalase superfamily protein PhnB
MPSRQPPGWRRYKAGASERGRSVIDKVYWYLFSNGVPRIVDFYTRVLGFEMRNRWPEVGDVVWAWLERGAATVLAEAAEEDLASANRSGAALYLEVADADALYDEFLSRGASIGEAPADTPNATREFELRDPDGNRLIVGARIKT